MEQLQEILGTERAQRFRELLDRSLWMSEVERKNLLDPKTPLFLVEAAFKALVEEEEFLSRLAEEQPEQHDYLVEMDRWLYREDKTFDNYPGFPDQLPQPKTSEKERPKHPDYGGIFPLPNPDTRLADLLALMEPAADDPAESETGVSEALPVPFLDLSKVNLERLPKLQIQDWKQFLTRYLAPSLFLNQEQKEAVLKQALFIPPNTMDELSAYLESEYRLLEKSPAEYRPGFVTARRAASDAFAVRFGEIAPLLPPTSVPEKKAEDIDPIGSFGLDELAPMSRFIKVPEHNLHFDENRFLTLLAGSISLTANEKHRIIEAIPRLSQYQIDNLCKVLGEEKSKFSSLDKKHASQLRVLEEKHRLEWDSVCQRYIMQHIKIRVDVPGFFDLILSIENSFQRLRWNEAEEILTTALEKSPTLPFVYEYQIQLIKVSEELKPDLAKSLCKGIEPHLSLFQVLTVFLEFEDIYITGPKLFLEHLDRFEPPREYPYITAYMLSKYHLYFARNEDAFKTALAYANEAIGLTDHEKDPKALLYLHHHLVRVLVARGEHRQVAMISKLVFGEKLPLYYRYLNQLGIIDEATSNEQCRYVLEQFILDYARIHQRKDLTQAFEGEEGTLGKKEKSQEIEKTPYQPGDPLGNILDPNPPADLIPQAPRTTLPARTSQPPVKKVERDKAWRAIVAITGLLEEMGFVDPIQQASLQRIEVLLDVGRLEEARVHIEEGIKALQPCQMRDQILLMDWNFSLLEKEGGLSSHYSEYKQSFSEHSCMLNGINFALLLKELDFSFRYEEKEVTDFLSAKYYYLTFIHCLSFETSHYKFKEGKKETPEALHIAHAISCGLDGLIFQNISLYNRWNDLFGNAINMGILGKRAFDSRPYNALIASQVKRFNKESLGLFIVINDHTPGDIELFNSFNIGQGQGDARGLASALYGKKSIDCQAKITPELMANKFVHHIYKTILPLSVFYSSMTAISCNPHHTWLSYPNLLEMSRENNDQATYLSALYTGQNYGCRLINDTHREHGLSIALANLETNRDGHFPFCVFLARALTEHKSFMIEEHGFLDMEARVFDCLYQAETLLALHEPGSFFLGDHAHRTYLSMTAQDWYLALRHPGKTVDQKYQDKLRIMRSLESGSARPEHDLRETIRARAIRELITSLNSGRVVSDALRTRATCIGEAKGLFARDDVVQTVFLEDIQEARSQVAERRSDLIVMLMRSLGHVLGDLDNDSLEQLESDLSRSLRSFRDMPSYQDQFRIILEGYQLKESWEFLVDGETPSALDGFAVVKKKTTKRIRLLRRQSRAASFSLFRELFNLVRTTHVLAGSNMFESVRKKIRHGWLIAHLKDCFARHELYMDGGDSDIPPSVTKTLTSLHDRHASTGIAEALGELKRAFLAIVGRLDKEILVLRDEHHPEGIFNYGDELFDLEALYASLTQECDFNWDHVAIYIDAFCSHLDTRTLQCFEAMRHYLETDVHAPLQQVLNRVESVLNQWESAFAKNLEAHHKLLAGVNDAGQEFARNIKIYQSWFQFYQEAVRDFHLEEALTAAEKQVWDIDLDAIRKKRLKKATIHIRGEQAATWLKGANFPELLEVFKILFQNVVYHGNFPDGPDLGPQIEIEVRVLGRRGGTHGLQINFSSVQNRQVPAFEGLLEEIREPARRARRLLQSSGTGLATIEDILAKRLTGATGGIKEIHWYPRLKKLKVGLKFAISEAGNPDDVNRTRSWLRLSPKAVVDTSRDHQGLKVLVVEDQKLKFDAIRDYLTGMLGGVHCTMIADIETTTRLLTTYPDYYHLLILDMTLPEDPSVDAPLKSLGGFTVLKVMAIRKIYIPTILVTQYSNWSAEAQQNTRVFIEKLDSFCTKHYASFYRATVRFSHTEIEWRQHLADAITHHVGKLPAEIQLGQLAEEQEREGLLTKAENHRGERRFREAADCYLRVLEKDPNRQTALAGLALTYAEEGDTDRSIKLVERYKATDGSAVEDLEGKILDAKLRAIEDRRMEIYRNEMMATLGKMAGGMAHELNTPLQSIKFYAQSLLRSMKKRPLTDSEIRDELGKIIDKTDFMVGQVHSIQTMARGERLPARDLDLNQLIEKSLGFFQAQLASHGIRVQVDANPNLPSIHANESRLQQVFSNLILNARDALDGRAGPREIHVRTSFVRGEDPYVTVYFSDTGSGIDPADRERIFDPFFTTKDYGKGMGLGLFNIRETIHEMGGSIICYDEAHGGVTFVIRLPVATEGGKT